MDTQENTCLDDRSLRVTEMLEEGHSDVRICCIYSEWYWCWKDRFGSSVCFVSYCYGLSRQQEKLEYRRFKVHLRTCHRAGGTVESVPPLILQCTRAASGKRPSYLQGLMPPSCISYDTQRSYPAHLKPLVFASGSQREVPLAAPQLADVTGCAMRALNNKSHATDKERVDQSDQIELATLTKLATG